MFQMNSAFQEKVQVDITLFWNELKWFGNLIEKEYITSCNGLNFVSTYFVMENFLFFMALPVFVVQSHAVEVD